MLEVLSLSEIDHLSLSTQGFIAMSIKTISIALRETNLYLSNQPAGKHPMGKILKMLASLVDGTKII